jgi:hypothetical protein
MMLIQFLQQFLHTYPFILPITIALGISAHSILFGSWAQLTKHYKYSSRFLGQDWEREVVEIGGRRRRKGYFMTVGINSAGLYLRQTFLFGWLRSPILIPWRELLKVEKDERWTGTFYRFHNALQPQIEITVKDVLFYKISTAVSGDSLIRKSCSIELAMEPSFSRRRKPLSTSGDSDSFGKSIVRIFSRTFLIGLCLGAINHGIAGYQVLQNPDRYQIHTHGQYRSPEYGKIWPHAFMEFLGLSQPVYVKVEKQQDEVISENFYSIFGSITVVNYDEGRFSNAIAGVFLSPLYTINCFLPLVLGCLSVMILAILRGDDLRIFETAVHSSCMGIMNFFGFYLAPQVISVFIRLALGLPIQDH